MYVDDFTAIYDPQSIKHGIHNLAIGWLDKDHEFPLGDVPLEFTERLFIFCGTPLIGLQTFGVHFCEFCDDTQISIVFESGKELGLGSSEIRIPSLDGKFYFAAPDLIHHYVSVHRYRPPQPFIDAVLACPLPDTDEFYEHLKYWLPVGRN